MLTKSAAGTGWESSRVREHRATVLPLGSQSCFMVMGLVSGWVFSHHFGLEFLVVHASPAKMDAMRDLEVDGYGQVPLAFISIFPVMVAY